MKKLALFLTVLAGMWFIWDTEYGAGLFVVSLVVFFIVFGIFKLLRLTPHKSENGSTTTSTSSSADK